MKSPLLIKATEYVAALKMKAIDLWATQMIEPLANVGNPEKLIKKPYEQWTPEDLAILTKIYGTKEPNPLSDLVFKREYARVQELEREEKI